MIEKIQIKDATLYLGDCREILPTLGIIDVVVTDPPYGIGASKGKAHSSIRDNSSWADKDWDNYRPDAAVIRSIIAMASEAAIWGGNYFSDCLPPSSGWLAWVKPEADTGFSMADMELCWTNKNMAARVKKFPRRDGNVHPTQKPVAVMQWCLQFMQGHTILDPYMGSGTTGVACVKMGKRFIGIERDPGYFEIACKRISEAYDQPDMFVMPSLQEQSKAADLFSYSAA